jgi:hypothetical protein
MNEASSRSHVVATINVVQYIPMAAPEPGADQGQLAADVVAALQQGPQVVTRAKMHLVDLAGAPPLSYAKHHCNGHCLW